MAKGYLTDVTSSCVDVISLPIFTLLPHIVVMSGNKRILTLFKTNNYSNLLIMSLYTIAKYIADGAMYMYKMEG